MLKDKTGLLVGLTGWERFRAWWGVRVGWPVRFPRQSTFGIDEPATRPPGRGLDETKPTKD